MLTDISTGAQPIHAESYHASPRNMLDDYTREAQRVLRLAHKHRRVCWDGNVAAAAAHLLGCTCQV